MRRHVPLVLGLALLVIGLGVADQTLNNFYLRIVQLMGIYVVLTVSLNLPNGFTGDFSLGHAAFMAVGGYSAALLTMPVTIKALQLADAPQWLQGFALPFVVATVIGGLLAALLALPIGLVVLRLRGHYLSVATIGLLVVVQGIAINWQSVTRGARGLSGLQPLTTLWWAFGWAAFTVFVIWRLAYSPFGRAMVAVRDDPMAAASRGVRVFRVRFIAFVVSAFFAGVGGSLLAHQVTAVTPKTYSFDITFLDRHHARRRRHGERHGLGRRCSRHDHRSGRAARPRAGLGPGRRLAARDRRRAHRVHGVPPAGTPRHERTASIPLARPPTVEPHSLGP